jgi:hypothetical protein
MKPLVPSKPGPPKDPKSFWAPWPVIREPCAKRTINGANSLTLEPLGLALFILTPSVVFSGGVNLARRGGDPLAQDVYPRRFGYTLDFLSPYSPKCLEEVFSEVRWWV